MGRNILGGMLAVFIIRTFHLLIVCYVLVFPWFLRRWDLDKRVKQFLYLEHALFCILLMLHWLISPHGCCLTYMEGWITGIPSTQTYIASLVEPIFTIPRGCSAFFYLVVSLMVVQSLTKCSMADDTLEKYPL